MNAVGKPERETQNRVIALFRDELKYRYLGDWTDRPDNSNIEEKLLTDYLTRAGHSPEQISRAIYLLRNEADNPNRSLYDNNKVVYSMLRYGVDVKIDAGKVTDKVKLINWEQPEKNDFVIVEEVTLRGNHERRPDLVIYVNGIAVAVIELKNSYVSIGDGIRQLLSNQLKEFNEWFFTTVQIVFAGNDSEGLRHGAIEATGSDFYILTMLRTFVALGPGITISSICGEFRRKGMVRLEDDRVSDRVRLLHLDYVENIRSSRVCHNNLFNLW